MSHTNPYVYNHPIFTINMSVETETEDFLIFTPTAYQTVYLDCILWWHLLTTFEMQIFNGSPAASSRLHREYFTVLNQKDRIELGFWWAFDNPMYIRLLGLNVDQTLALTVFGHIAPVYGGT